MVAIPTLPMKAAEQFSPRVLIADDQPDVREALRLLLKGEGYDTATGQEGLDLLSRIHSIDSTLPVVVMTAWGSVQIAVEAMRRGARDFVQKPWDNARLIAILRTQIELQRAL